MRTGRLRRRQFGLPCARACAGRSRVPLLEGIATKVGFAIAEPVFKGWYNSLTRDPLVADDVKSLLESGAQGQLLQEQARRQFQGLGKHLAKQFNVDFRRMDEAEQESVIDTAAEALASLELSPMLLA